MNSYLIRLTPLGKYFFGGDMTFQVGSNERDNYNETYSSYIISSNKYPQQTSLLGMMRYLILTKCPDVFSIKECKIIDKEGATRLIGKESFKVNYPKHNSNSFGVIDSISACFLMKGDDIYLPAPKDYDMNPDFKSQTGICTYNGRNIHVPSLPQYNTKEEHKKMYINIKTQNKTYEDNIFKEDVRIGINKNYSGKSDNNSFFKQISFRLERDYCFAFIIRTSFDLSGCHSEIVSLGGDNSVFSLNAIKIEKEETITERLNYDIIPVDKSLKKHKVILLSDSFIPQSGLKGSCFQLTETIPFRFLETNIDTKDYNILSRETKRSSQYRLYEKGSVFYFDTESDANNFIKMAESINDFKQIGYNKLVIHKNN